MTKPSPYLLERARTEGTPLLDGRLSRNGAPYLSVRGEHQLTFIWHGSTPPALTGDFNYWAVDGGGSSEKPFQLKQVEPNVWAYSMTVPRGAYLEYAFLRGKRRVNDPYNHARSPNGIGGINNTYYVPPAAPHPLLKRLPNIVRGRVTTHQLEVGPIIYGYSRKVHLYQPPTNQPVPLLLALDGQDYLRRVKLPNLLDNLITAKQIPPVAVAMVESTPASKGSARMSEYAANEATLVFLNRAVIPFAATHLNLLNPKKFPRSYAIMGASMSGLMAFFTAARAPLIYGTVISHAGAFEFWNSITGAFDLAAYVEPKPRVWLDVGAIDFTLKGNRHFYKTLKRLGYDVKYREYYAYHNWVAWRNTLPDALTWAFSQTQ